MSLYVLLIRRVVPVYHILLYDWYNAMPFITLRRNHIVHRWYVFLCLDEILILK